MSRRQIVRREPIESEVDDGRVFVAHPLPWLAVNELGNEIVKQNVEGTNEFVRLYVDEGTSLPQLEMKFSQKINDWQTPLRIAYPDVTDEQWTQPRVLDSSECAELLLVALDVNHLEKLKPLVDPNSPTPTLTGGMLSTPTAEGDGTKTTSTSDSSSSVSPESESSTSLEEKSLVS